jgi:hypothetical protein
VSGTHLLFLFDDTQEINQLQRSEEESTFLMRHDRNGRRTKGSGTKETIDGACTNNMALGRRD